MIEISGRSYSATVGSDIQRDGMYLEIKDDAHAVVAEVFYHDRDHTMTLTSYKSNLSLRLVEWMIVHAKQRLTPESETGS